MSRDHNSMVHHAAVRGEVIAAIEGRTRVCTLIGWSEDKGRARIAWMSDDGRPHLRTIPLADVHARCAVRSGKAVAL